MKFSNKGTRLHRWPSGRDSARQYGRLGRHRFDPGLGCHGGGNGSLLQDSCPGNPMDRRAWWAKVHGVTNSVRSD